MLSVIRSQEFVKKLLAALNVPEIKNIASVKIVIVPLDSVTVQIDKYLTIDEGNAFINELEQMDLEIRPSITYGAVIKKSE